MGTCSKCMVKERFGDTDQMLICDGCDTLVHTSCAGLFAVPMGDWLCEGCLEVLAARRAADTTQDCTRYDEGRRSLESKLAPLPEVDPSTSALAGAAEGRFRAVIASRKTDALDRLAENQRLLARTSEERMSTLKRGIQAVHDALQQNWDSAKTRIMEKHGIIWWEIKNVGKSRIDFRREDGSTGTVYMERKYRGQTEVDCCAEWDRYYKKYETCSNELDQAPEFMALKDVKHQVAVMKRELDQLKAEEKQRHRMEREDRKQVQLNFAKLLSEPKMSFETNAQYRSRKECEPVFMGVVKIEDDDDVRVLNILREPTELVISIPVNATTATAAATTTTTTDRKSVV